MARDHAPHTLDVLLPFWGDPEYGKQSVRSVLAQDCDDWRLTIVDDAYPDEAMVAWFEDLAAGDERITYVRNAENLGVTGNFRKVLSLATQEYVTFLGSDDLLRPAYVRTMLAAARSVPGIEAIQPGVEAIDESGEVVTPLADRAKNLVFRPRVTRPTVLAGERLAASLLRANWAYFPAYTYRREAIAAHGFRDGFDLVQDLALMIDLIAAGGRVLLLPDVLFAYRRHTASASNADLLTSPRFAGERAYFALAASIVEPLGWRRAARAARAHLGSRLHTATLLPSAVRARDGRAALRLLRHTFVPGTGRRP